MDLETAYARVKNLDKDISVIAKKVRPRLEECNKIMNLVGGSVKNEPQNLFDFDSVVVETQDYQKWIESRQLELSGWIALDTELSDETMRSLRNLPQAKRSLDASEQKIKGMDEEIELCNILVNRDDVAEVTIHGRRGRPEGLDHRVAVSSNGVEKRDVSFVLKNGKTYKVSLKGDIAVIQWCLQALNEVKEHWGESSDYYQFCVNREKQNENAVKDVLSWVATQRPNEVVSQFKQMYAEGLDRKKINAKLVAELPEYNNFVDSLREKYGVKGSVNHITKQFNDINVLKKFLYKYLTNDGNSDTLAVKSADGLYFFYKFDDLIDFYLKYGVPRATEQKVSIDIESSPSITMEYRTKGKHSLFVRQEMIRGPGSLRNVLRTLTKEFEIRK